MRLRAFESGNVKQNLTQSSMIICQFFSRWRVRGAALLSIFCRSLFECTFPFTLFLLYKQITLSVEGVKLLSETRAGKKRDGTFFGPFPLHPLKINAFKNRRPEEIADKVEVGANRPGGFGARVRRQSERARPSRLAELRLHEQVNMR